MFSIGRLLPRGRSRERARVLEAALGGVGNAIVEKSRAPDGSWAGAGAAFAAPSFELSACGTNGLRCVGEAKDVDDSPGDAVADVVSLGYLASSS